MKIHSTIFAKNLTNSTVELLCGIIYTPEGNEIRRCSEWNFNHVVKIHKLTYDSHQEVKSLDTNDDSGYFAKVIKVENLDANAWYMAELHSRYVSNQKHECINFCFFNTSNCNIPSKYDRPFPHRNAKPSMNKPLAVFFGSCYQVLNEEIDNKSTPNAYIRACNCLFSKYDIYNIYPSFNVLLGDQVYIDNP